MIFLPPLPNYLTAGGEHSLEFVSGRAAGRPEHFHSKAVAADGAQDATRRTGVADNAQRLREAGAGLELPVRLTSPPGSLPGLGAPVL